MANHSAGVSLGQRAQGLHRWRDEVRADEGSKTRARRRVRRLERDRWLREYRKS